MALNPVEQYLTPLQMVLRMMLNNGSIPPDVTSQAGPLMQLAAASGIVPNRPTRTNPAVTGPDPRYLGKDLGEVMDTIRGSRSMIPAPYKPPPMEGLKPRDVRMMQDMEDNPLIYEYEEPGRALQFEPDYLEPGYEEPIS